MARTTVSLKTTRLQVLFSIFLLTPVFCEQGILLERINSDPLWSWLTKYQLADGGGWSRDSSTGSYVVCDLFQTKKNETDSWLVSEYVSLQESSQVHLSITFTARACNHVFYPYCKQYFNIYLYQVDSAQPGGITKNDIQAGKFYLIAKFNATHAWNVSDVVIKNAVNATLEIQKRGFYFALQDVGGCFAVEKIVVFYNYCPILTLSGATFNKTVSPANGLALQVPGKCLENASPFPKNSEILLDCRINGEWAVNASVMCLCDAGYEMRESQCKACSPLAYKSEVGNNLCIPCPSNSHPSSSRNECICNNGFYRSANEPINTTCSTIPSEPRNLKVIPVTTDVIILSWQPPVDDGGRQDVTFNIICKKCSEVQCVLPCKNVLFWPGVKALTSTSITVSKLEAKTKYLFTVVSTNGVSGQVNSYKNATLQYNASSEDPTTEILFSVTGPKPTQQKTQVAIPQRQSLSDFSIATAVGVSVAVTLAVCIVVMVVIVMYLKHRWLNTKVEENAYAVDRVNVYSPHHNNFKRYSSSSMGTEMSDWTAEKTNPLHSSGNVLSFLPVNNIDEHRGDGGANTAVPTVTISDDGANNSVPNVTVSDDKASTPVPRVNVSDDEANTSVPNVTASVAPKVCTPTGSLYDVQLLTTHLKEKAGNSDVNNSY